MNVIPIPHPKWKKAGSTKEPLCKQKIHRKVLDKGLPEDVMPGIKNLKEGLPPVPLSGMLNKHGGKVRLTFKLENDQLWLSTKERTEKLPMGSIKSVISEPIEEHDEYHILQTRLSETTIETYLMLQSFYESSPVRDTTVNQAISLS
ncbi:hypothetical protein NQ318_023494 [Aromia moschata]|uniref:UBFD1 PH-like C-terminal domain-containing protein n=1 Tax=Aromia moschata TaxID=1265417 RepID=A0AAV8YRT0_9CUCU|nr:hypothetical protein NQ318_023494 [Aromia moschata]